MKQIIKMLCLFCGLWFYTEQTNAQTTKYMQIGFTSAAYIPTATVIGSYIDSLSGKVWNKYHLNCHDANLESTLSNYTVIEFEQEFPLVTQFSHTFVSMLSKVYRVRVVENTSNARIAVKLINSSDVDNVFINGDPILLSETNPNDYNPSNHTSNRFYASLNKSLDLINAKGAWEYTRGNENIVIGISDVSFKHNNDIDSKVLNLSTFSSSILPSTSQAFSHGLGVSCAAAAITNNDIGVASIGNKVSIRYYNIGSLNEMIQAALDGCKVINCSWYWFFTSSSLPPTTNDYNQQIIDIIHDYGVTIVAGAGNCNSGGDCSDYFYPASYNHVISVSSVGCTYDVGHTECFNIGGVATQVGLLIKDQHEVVAGYPVGNMTHCQFGYSYGYYNKHQHNDRVDICAPGYNVLVNLGKSPSGKDLNGGDWGTSYASPQVAGAAALLYSLNPNFNPDDLEKVLKQSAADISTVTTNYLYAGKIGAGRLDAGAACALVNSTDKACMHKVDNIDWKEAGGSYINKDDYWQYNTPITFSITPTGASETYEWEFVSGNEVVKKATTTPTVDLDFHSEFTTFVGPFIRENKLPLEVYVRRRNKTNLDCYSAFYKESGINSTVEGGYAANNGPYPSNNCDGNIYFNYPTILSGDYKAANIYIGSDFAGTSSSVVQSSDVAETNTMAANQIIMLPGTHIKRSSGNNTFFRSFIDGNCSIPNRWRLAGGGKTNEAIVKLDPTNVLTAVSNNLRAYPNPVINTLTLDFYSARKAKAVVYVTEINGKIVKEMIVNTTVGVQKFTIDTRLLTKGLYTVKVIFDNKQLITKVLKL